MGIIATLDACVLFSPILRDVLIRLSLADLYQARWSDMILEEMIRSVLAIRPHVTQTQLDRTRDLMNIHSPDSLVTDFEFLISTLHMSDENDRHVLAAAIASESTEIITWNKSDFPSSSLQNWGLVATDPDQFICRLLHNNPTTVVRVLEEQRLSLRRNPRTTEQFLSSLISDARLPQTVAAIRLLEGTSFTSPSSPS